MSKTLIESKVQIFNFIEEAEKCLEIGCGYSAVMTLFAVILAVSEAILGKSPVGTRFSEDTLIYSFFDQMDDKDWFIPKKSDSADNEVIKMFLYDLRNGLSHQLSLPQELGLIPTASDVDKLSSLDVLYYISVEGLIASVKSTVEKFMKDEGLSSREMDPNCDLYKLKNTRELGYRVVVRTLDGFVTSGSAVESRIIKSGE